SPCFAWGPCSLLAPPPPDLSRDSLPRLVGLVWRLAFALIPLLRMGPLLAARTAASGPISRFVAPSRRPRVASRICSHPLASHGAPARCSHRRLRTYLAIRCPVSSASCGVSHLLSSPCFAWC